MTEEKEMSKNIYVFCEQRDGVIQNVAYELLGVAKELSETSKEEVCAILPGSGIKGKAEELIGYGADKVYVIDDEVLKSYSTEPYAQAITHIVKKYDPNVILLGATSIGRDLAPRLSARLRTGLTADCTKLETDENGSLFMTRPAFGGNLFATIVCPDKRPQMSTVRPGVMKKRDFDADRKGEIIEEKVDWDKSKFIVKVKEEVRQELNVDKIEDAKILVSCGRGMSKPEHIEQAKQLAAVLKGTVSASRAVVDEGILDHDRQVGQTGKTVRPEVYMALGISGAVQHLAGMEESQFIIAVNKDENAPIFKVAHLGIVGDGGAVAEQLIKEIESRKS